MERDEVSEWLGHSTYISTHTLTWSVTITKYLYPYFKSNFNSHAHVERDVS